MHLTAYVGVGVNWMATLMVDHIPRFYLALHPEYTPRHYGRGQALYWLELRG